MSNQHTLRTKFIPFRPDTIVQTDTPINKKQSEHVFSHVSGHIYHNVYIDGGLMTQRVPVTSNCGCSYSCKIKVNVYMN